MCTSDQYSFQNYIYLSSVICLSLYMKRPTVFLFWNHMSRNFYRITSCSIFSQCRRIELSSALFGNSTFKLLFRDRSRALFCICKLVGFSESWSGNVASSYSEPFVSILFYVFVRPTLSLLLIEHFETINGILDISLCIFTRFFCLFPRERDQFPTSLIVFSGTYNFNAQPIDPEIFLQLAKLWEKLAQFQQ